MLKFYLIFAVLYYCFIFGSAIQVMFWQEKILAGKAFWREKALQR